MTTDQEAPTITWADLEKKYFAGESYQERHGLLHGTRSAHDGIDTLRVDALAKGIAFLVKVGDETVVVESDPRLRALARHLLAQHMTIPADGSCLSLEVAVMTFFAKSYKHGASLKSDDRKFLHRTMRDRFCCGDIEGYSREELIQAAVYTRAWEILRECRVLGAIRPLFGFLQLFFMEEINQYFPGKFPSELIWEGWSLGQRTRDQRAAAAQAARNNLPMVSKDILTIASTCAVLLRKCDSLPKEGGLSRDIAEGVHTLLELQTYFLANTLGGLKQVL